jgi:SAM-dependent methyltransferase
MGERPNRDHRIGHRSHGIHRPLERAAAYDWVQRLLGADAARRRFVHDYLRPAPGARLLDIGCGTGALIEALPPDLVYVGYDLNPAYIAAARRRYPDRAAFHCAAVGEGPAEEPASFDLVVAAAILHHLDDDRASQLVAGAWRALRSGGWLVTHDPVRHRGQKLVARALIALDRGRQVRTADGYRQLIPAGAFDTVETALRTDLSRVPYSHFVLRARKA